MKARPSKAWDRLHDASRRAMHAAEAALRQEMAALVAACIARHSAMPFEAGAQRVAQDIRQEMPQVILRGRLRARQASAAQLARQVAVANVVLRNVPTPIEATTTGEDNRRAIAASRSFADGWLRAARKAADARGGLRPS